VSPQVDAHPVAQWTSRGAVHRRARRRLRPRADRVVLPWEGRFGLLECSDTTMRFVPTGMSHTNSEEPGYAASETPNQSARVALPGRHAR
jgi:hypothetical protein